MRFATYNLWNSDRLFAERVPVIANTLRGLQADVIGLQEVRASFDESGDLARHLVACAGYPYAMFVPLAREPEEGLAILSRFPITDSEAVWQTGPANADRAIRAVVQVEGRRIGFTTVHLDASFVPILERERQIVAIVHWITEHLASTDHEILCGDFNCNPGSSIHTFLLGQQSLHGGSTQWFDLALLYAHRSGALPPATVDFDRNPRWAGQPTLEIPARFDWILLRDCYPDPYPIVETVGLFGVGDAHREIAGSDHYGVYADISFP